VSDLLTILVEDILPIFVVIGLGFLFVRRTQTDLRPASRLTFFVLSPCLVLTSLITSNVGGGEVIQIAAFALIVALIMGVFAWIAARLLRLTPRQTAAFLLATMFVNAGNFGLGVNRLAFGDLTESRAILYYVTSSIMVYTIGVAVARGGHGGGRAIINELLHLPHIYALIVALIIRLTGFQVPQPIMNGLALPSAAAVPMMLLLLGGQLATISVGAYWRPALAASALSLIAAPLIAFGLAAVMGLTGATRQASILEASMPAAVINTIIATEYDAEPKLVTATVVLSTLLSPITLTVIIAMLK
jgi:hypothetical protein